jgi:NAD(P)-dependent dehydrogenase (short-subunit alcohol dehydrogenase family)
MNPRPTTLITGAAKRIGAAIAEHLARQGHALVLHYHTSEREALALAERLRAQGTAVALVQADLSHPEALSGFWQGLPACNTLIHNASHYSRDPFTKFSAADLRRHLAVNLEAPLLLTQGFLKQLPAGVKGQVLVLGDGVQGGSISPAYFPYAVSKHAWVAIIELLAASLAPHVRANLIALAPTLPNDADSDGLFERLAARAPLKRNATVEEVLAAVDYMLAAPGVTGQVLALGSGMGNRLAPAQ